eukprot:966367-Amphidinium_carterae.1
MQCALLLPLHLESEECDGWICQVQFIQVCVEGAHWQLTGPRRRKSCSTTSRMSITTSCDL